MDDVVDNVTDDVVDCVYCMILTGILHSLVLISTVHSDPTRTFVHVTVFPTTIPQMPQSVEVLTA